MLYGSMAMSFYDSIQPFSEFSEIGNKDNFQPLPRDWVIVVTDIKGSTRAAREGRYKDVNMLGASAITILANEIKSGNTPSIFGGDGATLLMPETLFEKLRPQFVGLMRLALRDFALELRIGAVRASVLAELGCPVFLGKYKVSPNTSLAQIMGPGCNKAESLVKSGDPAAVILKADDEFREPDLNGLSCRLDRFASRHGIIFSIIVKPFSDGESTWIREQLIPRIKAVLKGDLATGNPVSRDRLNWRWIPKTLSAEFKFHGKNFLERGKIFLRVLLANFLLKMDVAAGGFSPEKYKGEVATQSDFQKFDDNLRMVLDCSESQAAEIETILEKARGEGRLYYGVHRTTHAVLTCVTFAASAGDHVHYVDGEGCGYTMASVQLKAQVL